MSQMFGVKCKDCAESSSKDYGWLVVGHCSSFDMHLTKRQVNTKRNCIRFKPKKEDKPQ